MPSFILQATTRRFSHLSALASCFATLTIAQAGLQSNPSLTAQAPTAIAAAQSSSSESSIRSSTGSPDIAPALSASQPHRPPTRPRLLASHWSTVNDDAAERHRWDDLDLQCRLASRDCSRGVEHDLLVEAGRKFAGGVGSEYGVCWAKLKAARNYDKALSIAICGDYPRREDLTRCGFSSFSCHDRLLCPRCCQTRLARPLADEFGDANVGGGQVFYIVTSLSREADESSRFKYRDFERSDRKEVKGSKLATPCNPGDYGVRFESLEDVLQCRLIWNLFADAVRELTGTGRHQRFLGVVGGPELSMQLGPLRVIPHCNFVVWTSSFTEDDARELRRLIRQKMRDCRPLKVKLYPSLACFRLRTRDDLRAVLSYSMKPIDLSGAYAKAAERVNYDPARMASLNREVNLFLRNLPLAFHQLPRITRHGVCHAGAKGYIGFITPWRAARRERDAERRRALRQNGSRARRNSEKSATPAKLKLRRFRSARFPHWYRAVMPGPPPLPTSHSTQ